MMEKEENKRIKRQLIFKYYYNHGNLKVPARYKENDINLGRYILHKRKKRKENGLEPEDIEFLKRYGMIWDLDIIPKLYKKYKDVNFQYLLILKQLVKENKGLFNPNMVIEQKNFYQWYRLVLRYGNVFMDEKHGRIWLDIYHLHIQYQLEVQKKQKKLQK